jgi:hypothetical protein
LENSLPQVTKQLPAYTAKNTRMNTDAMAMMIFFFSWKRLDKKSDTVMALLAASE